MANTFGTTTDIHLSCEFHKFVNGSNYVFNNQVSICNQLVIYTIHLNSNSQYIYVFKFHLHIRAIYGPNHLKTLQWIQSILV